MSPRFSILFRYLHFMLLEILSPISRSMSNLLKILGSRAKVRTISWGRVVIVSLVSFRFPRELLELELLPFIPYGFHVIEGRTP